MYFSVKSLAWPLAIMLLAVSLVACGQIEKKTNQVVGKEKPGNPGGEPPGTPPGGGPCGNVAATSMNLLCSRLPPDRPVPTHQLTFGNQSAVGSSIVELAPDSCTALVLNLTSHAVAIGSATPAKLEEDITIELKSSAPTRGLMLSGPTSGFFSDSTCSNAVSSIDLPKGTTQTDILYFKDPNTQSGQAYKANLTATPKLKTENPAVIIAPANLTVRGKYTPPPPPPAVRFAKAPGGETIKIGQCQLLVIHLAESASGASSLTANSGEEFQLILSSSSLTGSFYRNASCTEQVNLVTFPVGATKASDLYYRDYSVGKTSIAATPRSSQLVSGSAAALIVTVTP
ncbi:MAG: hypothetical protein NTY08_16020 [Proteobacteria bacterium]|nr:hypothetical protein [Pseudomonadota bacterium]